MEKAAKTESRVMENLINMKNWVMQDSGSRKPEEGKVLLQQKASSMVVPKGYYQDKKTQIAKDVSKRVGREKKEEERDYWLNSL
jgi:hypothetical protein